MTIDNLIIGKRYSVSSNNDCVITDTATGHTLASISAGTQAVIVPISDSITSDNDCVVLPIDEATVMPTVGQGGNGGGSDKPTAIPSPMGTSGVDFSYLDNSDPEHPVIRLDWPSRQYLSTVDTHNYDSMYYEDLIPSLDSGNPSFEMPTYDVVINAPELITSASYNENLLLNGSHVYAKSLHFENLGKITNLLFIDSNYVTTSISGKLPNTLVSGSIWAKELTDFNVDLPPSLVNMDYFFQFSINLENFTSSLQYIESGNGLFGSSTSNACKLSLASIQNVADTINDLASKGKTGNITIGYDPSLSPDDPDFVAAIDKIKAKGWNVTLYEGVM